MARGRRLLDALEISQALPGLNSVNLSVIVGDTLAGIPGAITAVLGFVLPDAIVIMALGVAWGAQAHNPNVRDFLIGVAAAAVGLLITVTLHNWAASNSSNRSTSGLSWHHSPRIACCTPRCIWCCW
jgi:chromate transport protein ChrA